MVVCDLFAGAGGFSLGLKLGGLEPSIHLEVDKYACETLRENFKGHTIIEDDIRFVDPSTICNDSVDVIVGGPPCQGFSVAGSSQFGIDDERNELVFWYLYYVSELKPKIAVIENVPNVLTKKSKDGDSFFELIEKIGTELGYSVEYAVLNAADYGVPQSRRRAFIVLHSPYVEFHFPTPTHSEDNQINMFFNYLPPVTVWDALSDLPEINAGENGSGMEYRNAPANSFQEYCRKGSPKVCNHESMRHTNRLIERFKIIKPGQSLKDVPKEYGQIAYGSGETVDKPYKYNNYRLDPSKPALTIPASFQSLFVHPYMDRNLTAREGARLMSYPDSYIFKGPMTMMSWEAGLSQFNQIGNSVCPLLGKAVADSVKKYLDAFDSQGWVLHKSPLLDSIMERIRTPKYDINIAREGVQRFECDISDIRELLKKSKYYNSSENAIAVDGLSIGLRFIEQTIAVLKQSECPICNKLIAPFGNHTNGICLLKSKSDLNSLLVKKKDNGLDFHLRMLTGEDVSMVNEVAEVMEKLDLITIVKLQNPRTGKMVKAIRLKT